MPTSTLPKSPLSEDESPFLETARPRIERKAHQVAQIIAQNSKTLYGRSFSTMELISQAIYELAERQQEPLQSKCGISISIPSTSL